MVVVTIGAARIGTTFFILMFQFACGAEIFEKTILRYFNGLFCFKGLSNTQQRAKNARLTVCASEEEELTYGTGDQS